MDSFSSWNFASIPKVPLHHQPHSDNLHWAFEESLNPSDRFLESSQQQAFCQNVDSTLESAFNKENDHSPFAAVTFPFVVHDSNIFIQAMELDIRGLDKDQTKDLVPIKVSVTSDLLWQRTSDFTTIIEAPLIPHPLYNDRGLIAFPGDSFLIQPGFQTVFLQMPSQKLDYHLDFITDPQTGLDTIPDISSPHLTILSGSGIQVQRNGEMRESRVSPIFAGKVYYRTTSVTDADNDSPSVSQSACVPSEIKTTIDFIHLVDDSELSLNDQVYLSLQNELHQRLENILLGQNEDQNDRHEALLAFQDHHHLMIDQTTRIYSRPYSGNDCPTSWETKECHNLVVKWYLRHEDTLDTLHVKAILYQYANQVTETLQNTLLPAPPRHILNVGLRGVKSLFAVELSGVNQELNSIQTNFVFQQLLRYSQETVNYQYAQVYHLAIDQQQAFEDTSDETLEEPGARQLRGSSLVKKQRILHTDPRSHGKENAVLQIRGRLWGAQFAQETEADFNRRVQNAFWDGVYVQDEVRFVRYLHYNALLPGHLHDDSVSASIFKDSVMWGASVKLYTLDADIPDPIIYHHNHIPWRQRKDLNLTDTSDQDIVGEVVKTTYLTSNGSPILSQSLTGVSGILFIVGVLLYYRQMWNKWNLEDEKDAAAIREEEDLMPPFKDLEGMQIDVPTKVKKDSLEEDKDSISLDSENDIASKTNEDATASPSSCEPGMEKRRTLSESTDDTAESYLREVFLDEEEADSKGLNAYANLVREDSIDHSVSSYSSGYDSQDIFSDEGGAREKVGLISQDHERKKRHKRKTSKRRKSNKRASKQRHRSSKSSINDVVDDSTSLNQETVFSWKRQPSSLSLASNVESDYHPHVALFQIPDHAQSSQKSIQQLAKQRRDEALEMLMAADPPESPPSNHLKYHVPLPLSMMPVENQEAKSSSSDQDAAGRFVFPPTIGWSSTNSLEAIPRHQLAPRRGSFGREQQQDHDDIMEDDPMPAHPFILERSQSISSLGSSDVVFSSSEEEDTGADEDDANPLFWFNALPSKRTPSTKKTQLDKSKDKKKKTKHRKK